MSCEALSDAGSRRTDGWRWPVCRFGDLSERFQSGRSREYSRRLVWPLVAGEGPAARSRTAVREGSLASFELRHPQRLHFGFLFFGRGTWSRDGDLPPSSREHHTRLYSAPGPETLSVRTVASCCRDRAVRLGASDVLEMALRPYRPTPRAMTASAPPTISAANACDPSTVASQ